MCVYGIYRKDNGIIPGDVTWPGEAPAPHQAPPVAIASAAYVLLAQHFVGCFLLSSSFYCSDADCSAVCVSVCVRVCVSLCVRACVCRGGTNTKQVVKDPVVGFDTAASAKAPASDL